MKASIATIIAGVVALSAAAPAGAATAAAHKSYADTIAIMHCNLVQLHQGAQCIAAWSEDNTVGWCSGTQCVIGEHRIVYRNNYGGNYGTCRKRIYTQDSENNGSVDTWGASAKTDFFIQEPYQIACSWVG